MMNNETLTAQNYINLAKESFTVVVGDYTTEALVDFMMSESGAMFVSGYILGKDYNVEELSALKEELDSLSNGELVGMIDNKQV